MLITLLLWAYLLPLGWLYGRFTLHWLSRCFRLDEDTLSFPLFWLAGMAFLTTLASFLSLFIKLAMAAQGIVLAGALLILVWVLRTRRPRFTLPHWHPLVYLLGALLLVSVLEISTHTPGNPDTGLYHAQTIRWIETYPAVPGLGNLHSRLAYNSSWLTLNALFSFAFLGGQSYHPLPGLLVLVICAQFLSPRTLSLSKDAYKKPAAFLSKSRDLLGLLFIPLAFFLLAGEISSPGTDLPAVLLSWLVFSEWLSLIEERQTASPLLSVLLILLTLWAVTIKLSSLPLLLAALFIFILSLRVGRQPDKAFSPIGTKLGFTLPKKMLLREVGLVLALAFILFLPWVIRSLILSGYLVYPGLTLDPFQFDWRIPAEAVRRESEVITAWARFSAGSIDDVLAMSTAEWIQAWFNNQTPNRQIIFLLILAAPFGYAFLLALLAMIKRSLFQQTWKTLKTLALPLLTAYAGIAFWFFKAPFFRFGYAFLIPALLLWLTPFLNLISLKRLQTLRLPLILLLLVTAFQGSVLLRSFEPETFFNRLIQPADYVNLPTAPCELHDTRVWCAEQFDVCGYANFPCVPHADPLVARRGQDLSDGFRHLEVH